MRSVIACICLVTLLSLPLRSQEHRLLKIALGFEGVTEVGDNRGYWIDKWNRNAKAPLGSSYCASFVTYVLDSVQAYEPTVRSALAQNFITKKSIPASKVVVGYTIPEGSIVVWKRGNTIYGHVGFTTKHWKGATGNTIEANTSSGLRGSQYNGDGVYQRVRTISPDDFFRITHFTLVRYDR